MTPEEALRAVSSVLTEFLNCEIQRENKKHNDDIVLGEIPAQNYFYNLLDLPNVDKLVNLELADTPANPETSEIEIDLSFGISGEKDYFRALRYQQALQRVLSAHSRAEGLNLKIESKNIAGFKSGSLKRYLISFRVSTTTI